MLSKLPLWAKLGIKLVLFALRKTMDEGIGIAAEQTLTNLILSLLNAPNQAVFLTAIDEAHLSAGVVPSSADLKKE